MIFVSSLEKNCNKERSSSSQSTSSTTRSYRPVTTETETTPLRDKNSLAFSCNSIVESFTPIITTCKPGIRAGSTSPEIDNTPSSKSLFTLDLTVFSVIPSSSAIAEKAFLPSLSCLIIALLVSSIFFILTVLSFEFLHELGKGSCVFHWQRVIYRCSESTNRPMSL